MYAFTDLSIKINEFMAESELDHVSRKFGPVLPTGVDHDDFDIVAGMARN